MSPNDVERILDNWPELVERAFTYKKSLTIDDYILIKRINDNLFEIIEEKSTTKDGPWNKEMMEKLLGSDLLRRTEIGTYENNLKYKRSRGCECGAWATTDSDQHAYYCPKYKKY